MVIKQFKFTEEEISKMESLIDEFKSENRAMPFITEEGITVRTLKINGKECDIYLQVGRSDE